MISGKRLNVERYEHLGFVLKFRDEIVQLKIYKHTQHKFTQNIMNSVTPSSKFKKLSDCNGTQTHNHLARKRTLNH